MGTTSRRGASLPAPPPRGQGDRRPIARWGTAPSRAPASCRPASRNAWLATLPALWLLLLSALLLGACLPPQASYSLGLGTARITGRLSGQPQGEALNGALVVVYKYHHQLISHADGSPVLQPSAQVLVPEAQGFFSIEMPADVVRIDAMFIAPGHLTELFRFSRQIGVGNVDYRASLAPMYDWRSHFYTYLSPQLQGLIVEPRYHLAPEGQQVLSRWLEGQGRRLETAGGAGASG